MHTPPTERTVTVVAHDELPGDDPEHGLDLARWGSLAELALRTEGVGHGELNLVFVDTAAMTSLNIDHLGGTGPTDVLAFPIDGESVDTADPGVPVLLGDVVVCPAVARRHAAERGVDFPDELALLIVHGVLHILGHDHGEAAEAERMQARERALLAAHHRS